MDQVTMADVAEKAGVSRSAVTAAFSDKASTAVLRPETRVRILDVARQLGYRPNILSRSFIKQQSYLIGMLGRETSFLFALETIKGIEQVIESTDYSLLTFYHGSWSKDQAKHLRKSMSRRVDGVIIIGAPEAPDGPNHQLIRSMQENGTPVVQIYRDIFPDVPVVMIDEEKVGYLTTQHLLEFGHRRIAHVTYVGYLDNELPGTHVEAKQRCAGYRRAMTEAGLEPTVFAFERTADYGLGSNDYTRDCSEIARQLAFSPAGFTAASTFNDYTTIGLIHCLREMSISVPKDISIIGYDNAEAGMLMRPALTTMHPRLFDIGRSAAEKILNKLNGQPAADTIFEPQLVMRQSTGPVRTRTSLQDGR